MWVEVPVLWWRMQAYARYRRPRSLQLIKGLVCSQLAEGAGGDVGDGVSRRPRACFSKVWYVVLGVESRRLELLMFRD